MSRRTRALRYGASIAVALVGVACGALIPGTAGGTLATVLVGIGLVGIVSLVFYEVGLTEDRDRERERSAGRPEPPARSGDSGRLPGPADREPPPLGPADRSAPDKPGADRGHQQARPRSISRLRGERRRLR